MTKPPILIRARHAVLWITLGWAASLFALVDAPLVKAAQARAWCVARTMVETGDLAVPRYNGEVRLKKPPLQSWVQAGVMHLAGSTDRRWAGVGSWLVGLLLALGPLLLGIVLKRPFAGFLGSLMLVTCRSAVVHGATVEHDVPFAGAIALSLAWLACALRPGARLRTAVLAGLACGAAVLIKGPFALAFVLGTALVAGGARRARPTELSRTQLWVALCVGAVLPASIWLGVLLVRLGGVEAVFDEMRRQALGESGAHLKTGFANVFFYVGSIPKWAMPWSVVLLPAVGVTLWRRRRGDRAATALPSFAVRSFAVFVLVLSIVPARQEHYLLPALPVGFLLGACALENALRHHIRPARLLPVAFALLPISYAVERLLAAARVDAVGPYEPLLLGGLVLLPLAALVWGRRLAPFRLVPLVLVASFPMTLKATDYEARRGLAIDDVERAVAAALPEVPPSVPILGFATGTREAFDTIAAYLDRRVERISTPEALRERLGSLETATILVELPDVGLLPAAGDALERVAEISPRRAAEKDRVFVYRKRD